MEQVFKRTKQLPKKITDAYQLQTKYWRHINKSENKKSEDGLSFSIINMQLATNAEKKDTFHQIFQRIIKIK